MRDYVGYVSLELRKAIALRLEAIGQLLHRLALEGLDQTMDDLLIQRALICRRSFGEFVTHLILQTELYLTRSAAGSSVLWSACDAGD